MAATAEAVETKGTAESDPVISAARARELPSAIAATRAPSPALA